MPKESFNAEQLLGVFIGGGPTDRPLMSQNVRVIAGSSDRAAAPDRIDLRYFGSFSQKPLAASPDSGYLHRAGASAPQDGADYQTETRDEK